MQNATDSQSLGILIIISLTRLSCFLQSVKAASPQSLVWQVITPRCPARMTSRVPADVDRYQAMWQHTTEVPVTGQTGPRECLSDHFEHHGDGQGSVVFCKALLLPSRSDILLLSCIVHCVSVGVVLLTTSATT